MSVMRCRRPRGAALVETALSLSLVLLFLLGSIQIVITSYYQISLDAVTFTHNRAIALGVPAATVASNVDYPFSSIITSAPVNVGANPAAAPNLLMSGVMYGSSGQGSRSGGVTQLLPQQSVAAAQYVTAFATVTSSAIEAVVKDVCPHFCMVDGGFGTGGAQSSATTYFGSVDDNSPYFGGFGFMKTCGTNATDALNATNTLTTSYQWDTCPSDKIVWRGISFGPQLTAQNYQMQSPGLTPQQMTDGYHVTNGTFFVAWCHRRFYAYIANQLAAWPNIPAAGDDLNNFLTTLFHGYDSTGVTTPGELIYAVGSARNPPPPPGWDSTIMFDPPPGGAHPYEGNENEGWGCWLF
jgi:hypothetical protein